MGNITNNISNTVGSSIWSIPNYSIIGHIDKSDVVNSYETSIKKYTPGVKKVIYNPPATIVFWSDNTKTTSKCSEEDEFDQMTGFLLCVAKKYMGGERLMHTLEKNVY